MKLVLIEVGNFLGPLVDGLPTFQPDGAREPRRASPEVRDSVGFVHGPIVTYGLPLSQLGFTPGISCPLRLPPMTQSRGGRAPTKMGERILLFMTANQITNRAQFAEGVLGISKQRFHKWLFVEMGDVEAKPLLTCAEALNTNPEYLLGVSDDPRPGMPLEMREYQLVEAFRVLSETNQDLLLQTAATWVGESAQAPSTSAPFRVALPTKERETR